MSDKILRLEDLDTYDVELKKNIKENYIEPLKKEFDGEVTVATFNITTANTTITLRNLDGTSEINWGDGTITTEFPGKEISHQYIDTGEYKCRIYNMNVIGDGAFQGKTFLTHITISDSVETINNLAFHACNNLKSVEIGKNVTVLGCNIFDTCTSLTNVIIPDSVTTISRVTFANSGFKNIVLGSGITFIGGDAFQNCSSLESIELKSVNPVSYNSTWFEGCSSLKAIYVPLEVIDVYKTAWPAVADKIVVGYSEIFVALYNQTGYAQIHEAYKAGKTIQLKIAGFNTGPDRRAYLSRIDKGDGYNTYTFTCDENGVARYYQPTNDGWKTWAVEYSKDISTLGAAATDISNLANINKDNIANLVTNFNRLEGAATDISNLANINKDNIAQLADTVFNTFKSGFMPSADTANIRRPGIYLFLQGAKKDKKLTITQNNSVVKELTCQAWIILSSDDGLVTPIGVKSGTSIFSGMFETPGTYQGWIKNADGTYDKSYSTKITYEADTVVWYLGNINVAN